MTPPDQPIRVLIVEDSRVVAEFLSHVLGSDPRIRVVGVAFDGDQAVEVAQRTRPDVITMDIHMPRVNGFEATRRIMEVCPVPIVIVSGSTGADEVATNFRAIEAGALAVVPRPNGVGHPGFTSTAKELVNTVKLMSEVKVVRRWPRSRPGAVSVPAPVLLPLNGDRRAGEIKLVAIGASTGGPLALQTILATLPKDFAAPILIVQHMAPGFVRGFVEWLGNSSRFPARVASDGEPLLPGHAYVAPDDFHMGVTADLRVRLAREPRENGMCPSVSFLFRSVAQTFGANAAGVLLTGMGSDGAPELKLLKDAGAITLAQDEESSVVHGMPAQAIQLGGATHVMPPEAMARTLTTLVIR